MGKHVIQQKDHIIIPKATLMRFVDDRTKKIHYLDLNDIDNISLKETYPKSFHSIPNYYLPEYDGKVTKFETDMGNLYKEISTAINNNTSISIDIDTLKEQIIDFITIECKRGVIADDTMLEQYKNKQQKENDKIDEMLLKTGNMTVERCNYSLNYRKQAKSNETFRYYAQNTLGIDNQLILYSCQKLKPRILYISTNSDCSFLLSPIHFSMNKYNNVIAIYFILSPDVVLALFEMPISNSLMVEVDKKTVDMINLSVLGSTLVFPSVYSEIVGDKEQLKKLKEQIDLIKDICKISENEVFIDKDERFYIRNMDEVMEFVTILFLILEKHKEIFKVTMKVQNFDEKLLENYKNDIVRLFEKYNFELIQ